MSGSKNREKELSDLIRYRSGEMTGRERNAFERKMQQDPFLADAAEGLAMVTPGEADEDMKVIRKKIAAGGRRRYIYLYSGVAATLLILVVSSVLLFRFADSEKPGSVAIAEKRETQPDTLTGAKYAAEPQTDKREPELSIKEPEGLAKREIPKIPEPVQSKSLKESTIHDEKIAFDKVHDRDTLVLVTIDSGITRVKAGGVAVAEVTSIYDMARLTQLPTRQADVAQALQGKVSGIVISSEDSMPIPGAFITIRGTQQNFVTGIDGRFTIPVAGDTGLILVANFIGMEKAEVRVAGQEFLNIELRPDILSLDEVVVVGYGKGKSDIVSEYSEPVPSAGYQAFNDYIKNNIRYPEGAGDRPRVVVVLDLPVSSGGNMGEPVIVRSPDTLFSAAAIKLVKEGPSWNPATMNGRKIDEKVRIRLVFKKQMPLQPG